MLYATKLQIIYCLHTKITNVERKKTIQLLFPSHLHQFNFKYSISLSHLSSLYLFYSFCRFDIKQNEGKDTQKVFRNSFL